MIIEIFVISELQPKKTIIYKLFNTINICKHYN